MIPTMLSIGDIVFVITKERQGSKNKEDLIAGKIINILSKGKLYKNGAKVRVEVLSQDKHYKSEQVVVGRVQYIIKKRKDLD